MNSLNHALNFFVAIAVSHAATNDENCQPLQSVFVTFANSGVRLLQTLLAHLAFYCGERAFQHRAMRKVSGAFELILYARFREPQGLELGSA